MITVKVKLSPPMLALCCLLLLPQLGPAKDSSTNLELARQLNQAFVEVAEKVSPTVVVINVVQKISRPSPDDQEGENPLDSLPPGFWRRFHKQFEQRMPEKTRGQGSGIIIRENGYILTNGHVVEDAESIEVHLQDGRSFNAVIRGVDRQSDVAVLKIEAHDLPVASLADSSKTRVGEFAIAIGAPFSLDYSVTFGHVSAKGRSNVVLGFEGAAMDQDFIQTDANINPGNSGGPLVNINGEVIGINTLIRGLHTGIGFAIPSSLAQEVAEKLITEGKFTRAWLGIGIHALRDDSEFAKVIKGVDDGVVVADILSSGPAAKSDLKPSDVITAVDGKHVSTPQQLRAEVRGKKIGQPVTLDVFRQGKNIQVKVSPAEWSEPAPAVAKASRSPAAKSDSKSIGLTVQNLTSELADQFGVDLTEGVLVTSVEKGTPADRKGFKPGDIITSVNQQPVSTSKQFQDALQKADLKKGIIINLVSANTARFEILKEEP
jgi:serine protease Do